MGVTDKEKTNLLWVVAIGAITIGLLTYEPLPLWRRKILEEARAHAANKTLYQWGGGRSPGDYGTDCSGLVVLAMRHAGIPLLPEGWTADVLFDNLPVPETILPGDLVFYGYGDHATHVEIVDEVKNGMPTATIGANDGGPNVTSPQIARAQGAFVKREAFPKSRTSIGVRTLAGRAPA